MTLSQLLATLRLPPHVECELVKIETQRRSMAWAAGAADGQGLSRSTGCAVRVIADGGQGLVKDTHLNEGNIGPLFERALLIARNMPKDPHRFLAKPATMTGNPPDNDSHMFKEPMSSVLDELKALEARALKTSSKLKKVVRLHLEEECEEKVIANSHGVSLTVLSTNTSFIVEALAEENGQTEVAWDALSRRFGADIKKEEMVDEVAKIAVMALGGKPLPSGAYSVLLHPRVATQLLSLLAQAFSAEAVQTGRSFLKDQLGKKVGSSEVNLMDDPHLARGTASVLFDDEAVASEPLAMIEGGVLKNYFFDLRTGQRAGCASNGRGFRAGLAAAPSPHATNLFIMPGKKSLKDLLGAEKKVFLLHDIMGLHMAEPVTGEFSLGASGFLYENGRFAGPVRGMTMAGSVGGLLNGVAAVGNEIHWTSAFGAPYILAHGITLSGQ